METSPILVFHITAVLASIGAMSPVPAILDILGNTGIGNRNMFSISVSLIPANLVYKKHLYRKHW